MVTIASRSSWGARNGNGDLTLSGLAGEVFIHHTASITLAASATVATERAQMRNLEAVGQQRFGTGISYNVVVFPSGRAYQGVSWNRRGTHTGGRNSTSRSIAFAGNFETSTPTAAALGTAASILAHGRGRWWTQGAPLRSHNAVSATACAGRNLISRMGQIRNPSTPAPTPPPAGQLVVDGLWGPVTTRRAQTVLRTIVDGQVSRQNRNHRPPNPGLTSGWQWVAAGTQLQGSMLIGEIQRRVGVPQDRRAGPVTFSGLQRHMGVPVTGTLVRGAPAIREMQRRLNRGTF